MRDRARLVWFTPNFRITTEAPRQRLRDEKRLWFSNDNGLAGCSTSTGTQRRTRVPNPQLEDKLSKYLM